MAYADDSDLGMRLTQQKLLDLTDLENTGSIDSDVAEAALNAASSIIDSYCGGRYALPLQPSDQVVDICLDLAIFKLYVGRQRPIPETVKDAHTVAMKFLIDVSTGKASLDQATVAQVSELNTATRDHHSDPEVFDSRKLKAF
ncbi:MAG: gp436 family protein [Candidatus Acidiferrales bacterium]